MNAVQRRRHGIVATALVAALGLAGCAKASHFQSGAARDTGPATVRHAKGSTAMEVVLTAEAARRIGIRTATIRHAPALQGRRGAAARAVIPYAAVLYDAEGRAFAYTNPSGLVYIRRSLRIARIDGRRAFLSKGPPAGTRVVTVGAAELLGVEDGVDAG